MNKRIVVLTSGMDSIVALQKAKLEFPYDDVISVYYDLGSRFSEQEKSKLPAETAIRPFFGYLNILHRAEIDGYEYYDMLYQGMIYDALRYYQPDVLWMGVLASDSREFDDNRIEWIEQQSQNFPNTELDYPLARMGLGKKEVIEYGLSIGVDIDEITWSHQCRSAFHGKHGCGSCFSCMRKKSALEQLGYESKIPPPTQLITSLLALQMEQYSQNYMLGNVSGEEFEYMSEVMPLLESTFGIKDDIFKLNVAIQEYYNKNKYRIEQMMENFHE